MLLIHMLLILLKITRMLMVEGHNNVIVQRGTFKNSPMKTMGVGVYKRLVCGWFGQQMDTYSALHKYYYVILTMDIVL
jgi:hypothetical protein